MPIERTTSGAIMCTGGGIEVYRLLAMKSRVNLESKGMKCRGPSSTSIMKKQFGMKRSASHKEVMDRIEQEIEKAHKADVAATPA